jgi:hypothetical protein
MSTGTGISRSTLKGAYRINETGDEEERYIAGASRTFVRILEDKLPYWSFHETMRFYGDVLGKLSNNETALLGCNDRFFLLTGLMNRVDAIHPWVYERAREVEQQPDGHLDLWARYHYKSTLITFAGSIQELLIDPETRICIFANNKGIATPFLEQIKKELESNEDLKHIYADVLYWTPATESPSWSVGRGITVKRRGNPRECSVEAHGLDALPVGKHFPILTYDDLITQRNVTNPAQIKKAVEQTELSFPIGIGEATRKRFAGTRYSYADAYGHLIEHKIAIPRLYPATDDGTIEGKPVFLTESAWAKVLREQRSNVAAQMLQNPIAGKENTFYVKWLKPYWVRPIMMNVYIMGDPAQSKSKTSDRTAIAVVGIDTLGNKYLLDGYCHRMKLSERWANLRDLWKKWKNMPGVQSVQVGYERYGLQTDMEYFEEQMREHGPRFEITELAWTGDAAGESKAKRVGRLEPDFRHGDFFVPGKVWHAEVGEIYRRQMAELGTPIGAATLPVKWTVLDKLNPDHAELVQQAGGEEFYYQAMAQPHMEERRCRAAGELHRLYDPLRRVDEDGQLYDLTRVFFEEFRFFPFSPRDDLIDAISRIYDMQPRSAIRHEHYEVPDYPDA